MNYKEEKEKSNSLKEFVLNKFTSINDYVFNDYSKLPSKNRVNEVKLSMVPIDLLDEVKSLVANKFNGDFYEYFSTVNIYFEKFDLELLSKCNIKESKIYEISSSKGKRKLSRERKHNLWHASVLLKLVGRDRAKYSSNTIFNEFKQSKKKEFDFIKNSKLVGKDRKILNLADCVKTSEQAIAEKLNLINVEERIAADRGWTWCFITLTLPGEFHPLPSFQSKTQYNGVSPRDSAKLLNEDIKRVRSLLAKWGIKAGRDYIGCSSAESHKDGCLHKHMLFFCSAEMIEQIRLAFEWHFPNLNDESFRVNDGRAKASSYIFKYVMKSITSYDSNIDFEAMDSERKNAVLNNAFRSYNFIRGFSFFGIDNCLTKFRFISRNLKEMDLPYEISSLVEENNLYELLTKGFFDMFENVYVKDVETESRTFVGCKFNGRMYFKRFFTLVMNAKDLCRRKIAISFIIMKKREAELISLASGLVILNHNYSREELRSSNSKENREDFINWLKENPIST